MNKVEIIKEFLAWVDQNTGAVFMEYEDYEYHYLDESVLIQSYNEYLIAKAQED